MKKIQKLDIRSMLAGRLMRREISSDYIDDLYADLEDRRDNHAARQRDRALDDWQGGEVDPLFVAMGRMSGLIGLLAHRREDSEAVLRNRPEDDPHAALLHQLGSALGLWRFDEDIAAELSDHTAPWELSAHAAPLEKKTMQEKPTKEKSGPEGRQVRKDKFDETLFIVKYENDHLRRILNDPASTALTKSRAINRYFDWLEENGQGEMLRRVFEDHKEEFVKAIRALAAEIRKGRSQ